MRLADRRTMACHPVWTRSPVRTQLPSSCRLQGCATPSAAARLDTSEIQLRNNRVHWSALPTATDQIHVRLPCVTPSSWKGRNVLAVLLGDFLQSSFCAGGHLCCRYRTSLRWRVVAERVSSAGIRKMNRRSRGRNTALGGRCRGDRAGEISADMGGYQSEMTRGGPGPAGLESTILAFSPERVYQVKHISTGLDRHQF